MTTRCPVWLDGQGLHEIDPRIIITDVCENPPAMLLATAARAQGDGMRLLRRTRQSASVTVRFLIREYAAAQRKALLQKVSAWAQGTTLAIGDRPGQHLHVSADALPTVTSMLKWTEELSVTLTAYALPYWQSDAPAALTTAASGSLMVEGTAPYAQADATLLTGGLANTTVLTVQVDDTTITLEGLSLPPGSEVTFTHDEQGRLHIACGGASLLAFRTAASADDLLAVPGRSNTVSCHADQPVTAAFSIKGVWA